MNSATQPTRVLLTRSSEDNQAWIAELAKRGVVGVDLPCIETTIIPGAQPKLAGHLQDCQGLLFTSPRAVRAVTELCPTFDLATRVIACVGEVTANTLESAGGIAEFIAPGGTALSLGQTWIERIPEDIAPFWPRAFDARVELVPLFESQGRTLASEPVYRTTGRKELDQDQTRGVDAVFFASPSAVNAFFATLVLPPDVAIISIGPSTTEALERNGIHLAAESTTRDLSGMLNALDESRANSSSKSASLKRETDHPTSL